MKYRKKPIIVEAFKWTGDAAQEEDPVWIVEAIKRGDVHILPKGQYSDLAPRMVIKTLEGDHWARVGDYIIQGVKGEIYPCKPDIFELTYEPVTASNV